MDSPPGPHDGVTIGRMQVRYLARSEATDDALGIYGMSLAPRSPGAGLHRHAVLTEAFEVHEGTLSLRLGEREVALGPGGFLLVRPGEPHAFANRGDRPVRFTLTFTPALRREGFFEGLAALAQAGRLGDGQAMRELMAAYDQEPLAGFAGWSEVG
ncbi:cupin domain-containing protein [Methylobacterium oryzisoli]|uniref:cupin domain-containing protein n=1 Tax=Methylobacterium oryzisoli TaxID=3385502 RepID=UPI00389215B4